MDRPSASSPAARKTMQSNRGKDTQPELLLRRLLREAGFPGYRLHWKGAPGLPDIAFPGRKVAVFVNGCFWHRCPHCNPPVPKANAEFWMAKFAENLKRDTRNSSELQARGWTVVTVWECQLKTSPGEATSELISVLRGKAQAR